jgi:predicted RNA binding protein YcfA (HicA-like mRNA interferase family)
MKIPRNIDAKRLIIVLKTLGYEPTRQTGSHIRLTTLNNGQHHITIPNHNPISIGTISSILFDIARHFNKSKEDLVKELF